MVGSNCWRVERHRCSLRFFSAYPASRGSKKEPSGPGICVPIVPYTFENWGGGTGPGKQSPGQTWQSPSKLCLLTRSQPQTGLVQWLPGSPVQLGPWPGPLPQAKSSRGTRLKALSSWQSSLSMSALVTS